MKKILLSVCYLLICASVSAKKNVVDPLLPKELETYREKNKSIIPGPEPEKYGSDAPKRSQNRVSLGVGLAVGERVYKTDREFDVRALPNVWIRYNRFYVRGIEVGAYLYEDKNIGVATFFDVLGRFRVKPSEMREGYRNINERKESMMYGVKIEGKNMPYGILPSFSYKINEKGGRGEFVVGRPIMLSQRVVFFPAFTATVYSGDSVGYYFGVSEEEVNRSTTDKLDRVYNGDTAYMYGARLSLDYRWTNNVSLSSSVGVQQFSDEIKNSPITEKDGMIVFGALGIRYTF